MDDHRLTRAYLETLSTDGLSELAIRFGLDLPAELNRVFVIEELLDASADETTEDDAESLREDDGPSQAEGLPETYNSTFIGVLLRDPLWAYAFWEIKGQDRHHHEQAADFSGYRLRIAPASSARVGIEGSAFTVPVGVSDSAWYLCLPGSSGWFRVDLCAMHGKSEEFLASSAPFRVPRGCLCPSIESGSVPPILALSGLADFRVLDSSDRQSRLLQRCES